MAIGSFKGFHSNFAGLWTGPVDWTVDWTGGLDRWTGWVDWTVDWTGGLDWTVDWTGELDRWTGSWTVDRTVDGGPHSDTCCRCRGLPTRPSWL